MKNIVCLCPNPCTDKYMYIDELAVSAEHKANALRSDIGGKGVNVASDIISNKRPCTLLLLAPEENSEKFKKELSYRGVKYVCVQSHGTLRENITLVENSGRETRISEAGTEPTAAEAKAYCDAIRAESGIIILSGSVQQSLKEPLFGVLAELSHSGNDIILDSKSVTKNEIKQIKPLMVKPNKEEAEAFCGFAISDTRTALDAAAQYACAGAKNVLVTLGKDGSLLYAEDGSAYIFEGAKTEVRSTVGAGDAAVAGYACAYAEQKSAEECLALSAAFSVAAVTTEGTLPPSFEKTECAKKLVFVKRLK